jgi:arginine decarboxylase
VPDILIVKRAVREAARYYAKLRQLGYPLEYIDVGGGLAVDYDGSGSTFHSSMNYSVKEYADNVIYGVMDVCDDEKVPHPHLVSESGRAVVAHHSVLVVEAFGSIEKTPEEPRRGLDARPQAHSRPALHPRPPRRAQPHRAWHDLVDIKGGAQKMFELGFLDLG